MSMIGIGGYDAYASYGRYGYDLLNDSDRNAIGSEDDENKKNGAHKSSPEECETCKERKYKDGSDENVSYKAATHISPGSAAGAVRSHEGEHVSNAYTKAAQKGGEVVSCSVAIHTAVCPECGRSYVSGGDTTTMIKYPNETNPYQQARKASDAMKYTGNNVDASV